MGCCGSIVGVNGVNIMGLETRNKWSELESAQQQECTSVSLYLISLFCVALQLTQKMLWNLIWVVSRLRHIKLHFKPLPSVVWIWFPRITFHVDACSDFLKSIWICQKKRIWAGSMNIALGWRPNVHLVDMRSSVWCTICPPTTEFVLKLYFINK